MMHYLRKFMGWVFGIEVVIFILGGYQVVLAIKQILRQHTYYYWNFRTWLFVLLWCAIPIVINITLSIAWWTIWKEKHSAKIWGIAASLIFIIISLYVFFIISKWVWCAPEIELAIGVIGLIAFLRPYEKYPKTNDSEPESNPS